ncbi:carbohydrate porin [Thermodesulfobacteriota bacterium]
MIHNLCYKYVFLSTMLTVLILPGLSIGIANGGEQPPSFETSPASTQAEAVESLSTAAEKVHTSRSMSNYSEKINEGNSAKSVEAELVKSDKLKPAIFPLGILHPKLTYYYGFKEKMDEMFGLAFSVDYSALFQRATWTESGERTGASHVFRILGTWLSFGDSKGTSGNLVWKTEGRSALGGYPTPRDLGFDTGSALSTANYKDLDWGVTNLYWRQRFKGGQYAFLVGHLDPGDWVDQYPLLNAWTSFMNDAFYNNPTEAVPRQGFAITGQSFITENLYLLAGVADANGKGEDLDFSSFWDTREWFSWAEIGFRGDQDIMSRQNAHVHYWHQDAREAAGTEESWGIALTYSMLLRKVAVPFIRAGFSNGDAPQLRRFIGVGVSVKLFERDDLGLATGWGSPPDKSLRDQITSEIFYRIQVTQNLALSPDIQLTYHPSFNTEKDWVTVLGLRMRLVF